MSLKKENFTDEQWAEIEAETDRERLKASKTARKNAEDELKSELAAKIKDAVDAERAKLEADEQGKLDIDRKAIESAKAELAAERKGLQATKKLTVAGLSEDVIDGLMPLFTGVDDSVLGTTLDTFIKTYQDGIKAQVDTDRQTLLDNGTAPISPTDGPLDSMTQALKFAEDGNMVAAFDAILPKPPA